MALSPRMGHGSLKLQACEHPLCVHGHAVRIHCDAPELNWPIHHCLGEFHTPDWPDGFSPIPGTLAPYDESVVMRHLSPDAVAIATGDELTEIYEHNERFWLVDDRWGLCELNLLKGEWNSWILRNPRVNNLEVVDAAVLWPMAQLLGLRGLSLVPGVSICRDGFGVLILSPVGLSGELADLIDAGWQVVGQRWTALQEDSGRVAMRSMPGAVERVNGRQLASAPGALRDWVDLLAENPAARANHSFVDAVVLIDAARRATASMKPIKGSMAIPAVKRAWPIFEVRPQSSGQQITTRLAAECTVFEGRLSRRSSDFVEAINSIASTRMPKPAKLQPQLMPLRQREQIPA